MFEKTTALFLHNFPVERCACQHIWVLLGFIVRQVFLFLLQACTNASAAADELARVVHVCKDDARGCPSLYDSPPRARY